MAKISFRGKDKSLEQLEKKINVLSKSIDSFEEKIEQIDSRINKLLDSLEANSVAKLTTGSGVTIPTSRFSLRRAKTEQSTEQTEQFERSLKRESLGRVTGRHREILAMLINDGFHTYKQIADKLNISQSRARAYIAELKNDYRVPLRHVRDPEGYKVGIDVRFVEEVLLSK